MARPRQWRRLLNQPQTRAELAAVRHSVRRGTPFGPAAWGQRRVRDLGLEYTVRPPLAACPSVAAGVLLTVPMTRGQQRRRAR